LDTLSFKKISRGEIKGWVREDILPLLPPGFFEAPAASVREMGGEVLRETRLRWAAIFTLPNKRRIFFKMDRTKGLFESLKYFALPSKAKKEWFIALQLQKRNLNIPKPLGWLEKVHRGFVQESYYLSEAIGSGVSLIEDSTKLGDRFLILELAKAIKKIHQGGLFHKDLHAGNFLWDGQSLFLTDLHSTKIVSNLSLKQRLWNLSLLFHSLRAIWGEEDQSIFMGVYFEGEPFYPQKKEEFLKKVHTWMDHLRKRQWQSRTKRCLKESTEFSLQKGKGVCYYHRRDFPLEVLKKKVEEHLRLTLERPSALAKYSPNVTISIIENGGKKLSVKNYHPLKIWDRFKEHFRRSRGLKAWIAGNGLKARGIPSLRPLGLVERRDWLGLRESSFLMEVSEADQEVDRYIIKSLKNFTERRSFIKAFARWLSQCHRMDLYHRDMKTCNILVSKDGDAWGFHLLDLEDVRLDKKVREKELFKTFLQLNTSTPKIIMTTDRFRFFGNYLSLNPIIKDRKIFLKRLIEESKQRGLVYVAPGGVVTEKI
jgi:tRNA A-37 threonylcarbamoyl transferase component Bud32